MTIKKNRYSHVVLDKDEIRMKSMETVMYDTSEAAPGAPHAGPNQVADHVGSMTWWMGMGQCGAADGKDLLVFPSTHTWW